MIKELKIDDFDFYKEELHYNFNDKKFIIKKTNDLKYQIIYCDKYDINTIHEKIITNNLDKAIDIINLFFRNLLDQDKNSAKDLFYNFYYPLYTKKKVLEFLTKK